jgi:MoaA/NifB/PqqE/SkfB family radical SAM enzyme
MSILFETVRELHIESTDICQAACPLCARETDPTFNKDIHHWLTVADIKRLLPEKVIYRLDKMFMCGNYGDPAANSSTNSIFSYFREVNSSITLGMNTNGGLQNKFWWADLANILYKPTDYVVFSIDGLEDTNHLYRKGVDWQRIMHNAETFINSGGSAHWDMLVYEHNEHQVDACQQLAKDMGFTWFRAKVSKRTSNVEWLKPPKAWRNPVVDSTDINCRAISEQSIYLDSRGQFFPCCWQGYTSNTIEHFENIKSSWSSNACDPVCKRNCGSQDNKSSFSNQWQRVIEF